MLRSYHPIAGCAAPDRPSYASLAMNKPTDIPPRSESAATPAPPLADSRVEGWIRTLLTDSMLRPLYAVLLGHGIAFFAQFGFAAVLFVGALEHAGEGTRDASFVSGCEVHFRLELFVG